MELIVFADEAAWLGFFAAEFRAAAEGAGAAGSVAVALCLAGGSTPEPVYRALSALPDPGLPVELWLGDERAVPPSDPARNGGMVSRAFAAAPWARLRPWPWGAGARSASGTPDPEASARLDAAAYAAELSAALGPHPVFDLLILGLGSDGHTASLFPGDAALGESGALASVSRSPLPPPLRMTLTYPALARARRTLFAVAGPGKREIVLRLAVEDPSLPASVAGGGRRTIAYLEP
jgi:6-phosphogluconolactonase